MDFKEGPDTIDVHPCPSSTAQAVKKNTLHLGMNLTLLHPKYAQHSITSVKLEHSKRREQGKPSKNSQSPKRK